MVSQRLKYYRAVQNLTQRDLALAAGISPGHVGTLEMRDSGLTLDVAIKIKKALGLPNVERLLEPLSEFEREKMKKSIHARIAAKEERRRQQQREQKIRHRERMKLKEATNAS